MESKIYKVDGKEIHLFGFYVGVIWSLDTYQRIDGTPISERTGAPYIGFPWIRGEDDDIWLDEDSTLDGGLSADQADEVAQGLLAAAAYIRAQEATS